MPRRGGLLPHPCDYLAAGQRWPHGGLVADAPPEAALARAISLRLHTHLDRQRISLRQASQLTGASPTSLHNIVRGHAWSDMTTLARIERGLCIGLWGDEHRC